MKNKFPAILAVGLLAGPLAANADLVQSTTSVHVTFRQCISGATACDSVSPVQIGSYGGLPGELAAQASQVDPAYGASSGSAQITGAPGAAELTASATSLPATRNGSNSFILQRYTNTGASTETLNFDVTLTYDQTVPAENAGFPADSPGRSGAVVEFDIFTMSADSFEAGTTAEENNSSLYTEPGPDTGFTDLKYASIGPVSNVTGAGTTALSRTVTVNSGDSIWLWTILQSLAANGAVVNASLDINLESTTVEKLLQQLLDAVTAIKPGTSLAEKVALAQVHNAANEIQTTCEVLQDSKNQVQEKTGKKKELTVAQTSDLTNLADDIMEAIGCTP